MPGGLFALLDDIGLLMDDVAAMTKVAGKKTAGILGDDLAVNAEKAVGFSASRELPVLWAITKGSFLNKLIDHRRRIDVEADGGNQDAEDQNPEVEPPEFCVAFDALHGGFGRRQIDNP